MATIIGGPEMINLDEVIYINQDPDGNLLFQFKNGKYIRVANRASLAAMVEDIQRLRPQPPPVGADILKAGNGMKDALRAVLNALPAGDDKTELGRRVVKAAAALEVWEIATKGCK